MNIRQSGEVEVVLREMTVHGLSSAVFHQRYLGRIDAGSVNQDPSKTRHDQCLAAARHQGLLLPGGLKI